jgi:uncharacterized protein (DUF2235 family)
MAKKLVLCCDGTNNQFDNYHTNVVRTYKICRKHSGQITYYDPGVGTLPEPWSRTKFDKRIDMLRGLAFGSGFLDNISDAYRFLMASYEPGDQIFLFGFSRGAFTARAVAALLHSVGLLPPGPDNLLPYARAYWQGDLGPKTPGSAVCAEFKSTIGRTCPVHFIGVWDTVGSVGYINSFRTFPHTAHNPEVTYIRHAVSIDERRSTFRQNLMSPTPSGQDVKNVYFAGVHSDVGGGYPPGESALAKIAFAWMMREAGACGLDIDPAALDRELTQTGAPPDSSGPIHQSLKGFWWLGEMLPIRRFSWADRKWHWHWLKGGFNQQRDLERTASEPHVFLHRSVIERMQRRPDYRPSNLPNTEPEVRSKFKIEM